jgi:uncharacterized RDD family membrane protein YckC
VQASLGFLGARVWGPEVGDLPGFLPLVWFFTLVFAALYTAGLHALGGQTIGKLLVGVRVVGADGEPPPLGTALLRWTAYFASLGTLGLGYAMAGLRQDRRALHDLIAGTRVERLPRRLDAPEPVDDPHASAPLAQPPG